MEMNSRFQGYRVAVRFVRSLVFAAIASMAAVSSHAAITYVSASHTVCVQPSAGTSTQTCTLASPTTAGDDVVVGVAWHNTSNAITNVAGSLPTSYFFLYSATCNGSNECVAILICHQCAAQSSITTKMSGGTAFVTTAEEYAGAQAIGVTGTNTATSTAPGLTMTTGDPNNVAVCATSSRGNAGIPITGNGALRDANRTGATTSDIAGAIVENTVASAGSVSCTGTITSGAWAAAGVELRSVAPKTYIWPDCDSTHPCVVHHMDTVATGTADNETPNGFKLTMAPSSPGNLLILSVTHASTKTITVSDNKGGNWQTAITATNSGDQIETEMRYVCGAAAGTNVVTVQLSQPAGSGEVLHFSYNEVSGIAPSSCLDGSATGAVGLTGNLQPGAITTSTDGDLIYNFGEESFNYPYEDSPLGWIMPDDNSALLMENTTDNYASQVSVQPAHGPYNPTLYANADLNSRNWNSVAAAFKPSSGAGTQPTGIHVTRIMHFYNQPPTTPAWIPFPSSGNAVVITSAYPSSSYEGSMTGVADNQGDIWTRTPFAIPDGDPQIYFNCFGSSAGGRDLTIAWKPDTGTTHMIVYDIAGGATTGGPTGCVGATVNSQVGTQPSVANSSIFGGPVITPQAFNSLVIAVNQLGIGPPSGTLTPGVVFTSIWATGMTDATNWDSGDCYGYIYTTSTNPISFDWSMANSNTVPDGASGYDSAAIEILPAVATQIAETITVTNSPVIFNGSPQGAIVTGSVSGTVNNVLYSGSSTVPAAAGTYAITADFIPTDTTNYTSLTAASAGNFVINQATPAISVTNSPVVANGNPQAALVSGSVAGTVSNVLYSGSPTVPSAAGTYAITADFAPADATDYIGLVGAAAGSFVINTSTSTPTLTVTNSPVVFNGSPQAAIVTGSVPGTVSNVLYSGSATVPTAAGTYAITANFIPADTTTYNSLTGATAGNFVIGKATPTFSVTNSPVTYNGSARSATVTGSIPGTVSNVQYSGSSTVPSIAGTYAITANFTPADTTDYSSLTAAIAGNFVINKATPTLNVTNSPLIYNGNPRPATVTGSAPGTVSSVLYSGAATVPASAATYAITANFTPTDTNDYNSLTGASAGNFVINKATPTLTVSNSPVTANGNPQSAVVSGSATGTVSNVLYSGSPTVPSAPGTYAITADFAPADTNDYNSLTGASAGNFVINMLITTPTLSVTNSPVTYNGSSHAASVSASVPGTVSGVRYSGSATVPTKAGTYAITANFTPTDTVDYKTLTGASAGNFVISKATPTLSVSNSPVTYNGSARSATVRGSVSGTVSSVQYSGSSTAPTSAGTYAITANFTPSDTTDYNVLTAAPAGNFVINRATPTIHVSNSPATYNGTPRPATVTGSVPGTASNVLYSGSSTVPTAAATYTVVADFTPADTTDYNSITASSAGSFVINKATPTIALSSSNNPSTSGTSVTFTATLPSTATGTVTFKNGNSTLGTGGVSNGIATFSTSTLAKGRRSITASYGGDADYKTATSSTLTQTVN